MRERELSGSGFYDPQIAFASDPTTPCISGGWSGRTSNARVHLAGLGKSEAGFDDDSNNG